MVAKLGESVEANRKDTENQPSNMEDQQKGRLAVASPEWTESRGKLHRTF